MIDFSLLITPSICWWIW